MVKNMPQKLTVLAVGVVFGLALGRGGATEYDLMAKMFTGRDLRIALLMATAIVVGFVAMRLLGAVGRRVGWPGVKISVKRLTSGTVVGGALFGVGWALTGACPGTVLAQLGEGRLLALFSFGGIVLGTYLYGWGRDRWWS